MFALGELAQGFALGQARFNNLYAQSMANQYGGLQNVAGASIGQALAMQEAGFWGSRRHPLESTPAPKQSKKEIPKAYLPDDQSVYESLKKHVEEWAK